MVLRRHEYVASVADPADLLPFTDVLVALPSCAAARASPVRQWRAARGAGRRDEADRHRILAGSPDRLFFAEDRKSVV